MKSYDLAVVGAGPGGYVSAIYASRLGLKACLIESGSLGGTCLNRGCIPTKVMLNGAKLLSGIKDAHIYGVDISGYEFRPEKLFAKREEVVARLRSGILSLLKANKVDLINGRGRIKSKKTVQVGDDEISAKNIIIATGSSPQELPGVEFDNERVLSSEDVLKMTRIPKSILIIGGGVIGCEFATFYNAFGAKVTIVELMDRLLPTLDREIGKRLEAVFKKNGVEIRTSARVNSLVRSKESLKALLQDNSNVESEIALVSVGRRLNSGGLGLEGLGIRIDKGRIAVDEYLETGAKGIYAVGDCIGGPMLAHAASYEGIIACDNIAGKRRRVDFGSIPSCIFTSPEIAFCGLQEDEAKRRFPNSRVVKFPYMAASKANVIDKPDGFIKIVGDEGGRLLGVAIMGEGACELIGEASLAISVGVKIEDIAHAVHAHPTLSELYGDVSHLFLGRAIHTL